MPEKILRDPVHDVVAFRLDHPGEALLWSLLQTPEFQRLRRVRQLGLATLAYPGADHTRFSHSLGVMEMSRRMLDQLSRSIPISDFDRIATTAAALLHDLGHGPFSHVFERVSGIHHEALTRRVISEDDSSIHRLLTSFDPSLPNTINRLLGDHDANALSPAPTGQPNLATGAPGVPAAQPMDSPTRAPCPKGAAQLPPFLSSLISSQLDADRLDYLLRDDLMTGSRYGQYDLQWLLRSLTVEPASQQLAVSYKGISAVEGYLQARHHMYRNVYFHKVVRAGEGMLRLALQRARRLAVQDRLPNCDPALTKSLLGQRLTTPELIGLDDVTVLHSFKLWTTSDDPVLANLCHGLLFRKLFKTVELPPEIPPDQAANALKQAVEAVTAAGGDPSYDLFYDEPSYTPYESPPPPPSSPSPSTPPNTPPSYSNTEIQVLSASGELLPLTTLSPFVTSLKQFAYRRIHVREEFKDLVLKSTTTP